METLALLVDMDNAEEHRCPEETIEGRAYIRPDILSAWQVTFWSRGMVHGDPSQRHIRIVFPPDGETKPLSALPTIRFIDLGRAYLTDDPEEIAAELEELQRLLGLDLKEGSPSP